MKLKSGTAVAGIAMILAVSSVFAQQSAPKWGPHVDLEAKPGTDRSIGEADFFLPLMQDGRTLFFGNARLRIADHDNQEGNFGLGVRRMLDAGWNIGGYSYYDHRRSQTGNTFNQFTFGAEALGANWDFRANGYLPQGDRVKNLGSTGTASFSGNSLLVATAAREERALKGYDAEVGWRVPAFDLTDSRQLRVYLGGYQFTDDVLRVSGPRARIEMAMAELPGVFKGAQLFLGGEYQDDNVRGSQGFVSVRLRIPLGGASERASNLNWQERRMTAPIVRDVDIVAPIVTRAPVTEIATALANGQTLIALSSTATTGAALPGAVAAAGANSTVVLGGTFTTTATTTLQTGQTLMGAGTLAVRTASGQIATVTTPGATINGNTAVNGSATVQMANSSTLSGMTVTHFSSSTTANFSAIAVRVTGTNGAVISNNNISASIFGATTGSAQGILVQTSTNAVVSGNVVNVNGLVISSLYGVNVAASSGTVTGNTITVSGTAGVGVSVGKGGIEASTSTLLVSGNTLNVGGGGAGSEHAVSAINSTIMAGSTGNVLIRGDCNYRTGNTGSFGFTDGTPCP